MQARVARLAGMAIGHVLGAAAVDSIVRGLVASVSATFFRDVRGVVAWRRYYAVSDTGIRAWAVVSAVASPTLV